MKQIVLTASVFALIAISAQAPASDGSAYAGQEVREIKALSESDVAGLLSGKGMGYAKAAELNGYPGPRHVLDLAGELDLTRKQRAETQELFNEMRSSAKDLGADLVAAERALDALFRNQTIDQSALSEAVAKVGRIEARLREVHLHAHVRQAQLLSRQQIADYMTLRGYDRDGDERRHDHDHEG